jgi:hypothetical protein
MYLLINYIHFMKNIWFSYKYHFVAENHIWSSLHAWVPCLQLRSHVTFQIIQESYNVLTQLTSPWHYWGLHHLRYKWLCRSLEPSKCKLSHNILRHKIWTISSREMGGWHKCVLWQLFKREPESTSHMFKWCFTIGAQQPRCPIGDTPNNSLSWRWKESDNLTYHFCLMQGYFSRPRFLKSRQKTVLPVTTGKL